MKTRNLFRPWSAFVVSFAVMTRPLLIGILIVGLALTAAPNSQAVPATELDQPPAPADFNGDWYADLAIGVPYEDVGSPVVPNAGAVNILYGGHGAGLSTRNNRTWSQNDAGVVDNPETDDRFGYSLAVGDFDGDGYYDLAVGMPYEDIGPSNSAGAVHIFYGTASGLAATGNRLIHQDSTDIADTAEADDLFGYALAVGDFNRDGYDDLAVGVPNEDVGSPEISSAGAVSIIYGSAGGLSSSDQFFHQDTVGVEGVVEAGDSFGYALAAGDFDHDGYDDLAVGVPYEDVGNPVISNVGAVNVLYGSAAKLTATGNQLWTQDSTNIEDTAEANDNFGHALAAGDFNGDGRADLAVGVPYEDVGSPEISNAGAVNVIYGSASGLSSASDDFWHQDSPNVEGAAEESDYFGMRLAAGDFNGDGRGDLAVGVPYENVGVVSNAGAVNVLYGSAPGLTATGDQIWDQESTGIQETAETFDLFGYAVAVGDFDGDSYADLVVGVPYEDIGSPVITDAGVAQVIYGSANGLTSSGDQLWHQDVTDVAGTAEAGDLFGYALAAVPHTMHHVYMPLIMKRR